MKLRATFTVDVFVDINPENYDIYAGGVDMEVLSELCSVDGLEHDLMDMLGNGPIPASSWTLYDLDFDDGRDDAEFTLTFGQANNRKHNP